MPKSVVDTITALMRKHKVELDDAVADAIESAFNDMIPADAENVIADGYVAIRTEQHDSMKRDLKDQRVEIKSLKSNVDDLKEQIDDGDAAIVRRAEKAEKKLERLEPFAQRYLDRIKKTWDENAENIPDDMRKYFEFAGDDGELDETTIARNVEEFEKLVDVGAITIETNEGEGEGGEGNQQQRVDSARRNQSGKHKQGGQKLDGMSTDDLLDTGIEQSGKTRVPDKHAQ